MRMSIQLQHEEGEGMKNDVEMLTVRQTILTPDSGLLQMIHSMEGQVLHSLPRDVLSLSSVVSYDPLVSHCLVVTDLDMIKGKQCHSVVLDPK